VGFSRKKRQFKLLIVAVALILAGAFGNIIDSVFYGVILMILNWLHCFQNSLMALFPGKVVDMFYFHFGRKKLPDLVCNDFTFNAIFNVADMAISTGVGY
jgi:signal peptidase II